MKFNYHQTTKIIFGAGRIAELGTITSEYGKKVLLVTTPAATPALQEQYNNVKSILTTAGLEIIHFEGVIANPTVYTIAEGAKLAQANNVEVIIGLGGGSSMDAAKAISVEATHGKSCWEYLFYKTPQPDYAQLLPIIAVSTTSGTGSQVTQVSVITHPETRDKSALYNNMLYPKVAIIDPELMLSVPKYITATTGFDVFCHAFESIINVNSQPMVDLWAWEAVEIVLKNLPALVQDLGNIYLREKLAYADLLAGLSIANVGVTLPHGMGMAIGGMYPNVAHGEALAMVYPSFVKFTQACAVKAFARIARILNPVLEKESDVVAAENCRQEIQQFLINIGLSKKLSDCGMPEAEIETLAKQCMVLPDYLNNPRVIKEIEMIELVKESF